MEASEERQPDLSTEELRSLLSPAAPTHQHIEGLLVLGLTEEDLFNLLEVTEKEMGLLSDEKIEKLTEDILESIDEREDPRQVLIEVYGATEEDLLFGPEYCIGELAEKANDKQRALYADERFLSRRGKRIFEDLRHATEILMENEENRPRIASWLKSPNHFCEGDRPIDRLKIDPLQALAAAHGMFFEDEGKIPDLYEYL